MAPASEACWARCFTNRLTEILAGAIGVFLLWLVIWSGLRGTEAPDRNFSLTFVFITVWVGMVFVSAVFGDVFRAFNPWRAIARAVGGLFKLVARPVAAAAADLPRAPRALARRCRRAGVRLARARLRAERAFRPSG